MPQPYPSIVPPQTRPAANEVPTLLQGNVTLAMPLNFCHLDIDIGFIRVCQTHYQPMIRTVLIIYGHCMS